jgi:hypothetical protein
VNADGLAPTAVIDEQSLGLSRRSTTWARRRTACPRERPCPNSMAPAPDAVLAFLGAGYSIGHQVTLI